MENVSKNHAKDCLNSYKVFTTGEEKEITEEKTVEQYKSAMRKILDIFVSDRYDEGCPHDFCECPYPDNQKCPLWGEVGETKKSNKETRISCYEKWSFMSAEELKAMRDEN